MTAPRRPVRTTLVWFLLLALALGALLRFGAGWNWIWSTLAALNLAALPVWGWDKRAARRDRRRVPERALHAMAVLGAAPASLLAMALLRHKSSKAHFWGLYAVLLALQIGAVAYFLGGRGG